MSSAPTTPSSLDALRLALSARRAGTLGSADFCAQARALTWPASLPPVYGEALADLLDRLESSALFAGESCSFSDTDLLQAMQAWLDRAEARLLKS